MSSPTIRYSGVPENSHSRETNLNTSADFESDTAAYSTSNRPSRIVDLTERLRRRASQTSEPTSTAALGSVPDSPDPRTPGAYRYRTHPDQCDLDAPESDPSNPRYEPDHLRHQPGDDWIIDTDRPYDVLDPGPYGTPGWFPDKRTGRHRRGELPDPIPRHEIEEDPEKAEWAAHAEALYDRRTGTDQDRDQDRDRDSGSGSGSDNPGPRMSGGSYRPTHRPRPGSGSGSGSLGGYSRPTETPRAASRSPEPEAPHYFGKLREDAWDRFMDKSAELAAAHRTCRTAIEREGGPVIGRFVRLVKTVNRALKKQAPQSLSARPGPRTGRSAPLAAPAPSPVPRPRESADRTANPVPQPRGSADRTATAARTARFAQALRGAQRARVESAHLTGGAAWA